MPNVVNQSSAEIATYSWFADGSKYSVLDNSNNGYYYTGSLIYASNNGNLQIESTDFAGGRINLAENTSTKTLLQDIQYHHKDHLGSVRVITDNSGSVIEQNAYCPFGSRHTFGNTYAQTTNRFKFNGKEEQTTGNLQYLDYGARMYNSNTGRWTTQDPLAEKYYAYSQYSFSGNNPILNIDSDGKAWDTFIDAAFLIYDLGSALYNHIIGEHSRAKQNWKDVGIDAASMIIPGVAAPMMKGVGKVASEAIEVANKLDNNLLESTLGKTKGSISATKDAVKEARSKLNLAEDTVLEKNTGKYGTPMRGNNQKGYRLDPAHPNAIPGSGEEYPHINYWDYTNGKRKSGGIKGVIPIKY